MPGKRGPRPDYLSDHQNGHGPRSISTINQTANFTGGSVTLICWSTTSSGRRIKPA